MSGSTVYLSNDSIEGILGADVLEELSHLSPNEWNETSKRIIEREATNNLHMIRLSRKTYVTPVSPFRSSNKKQSDIIRENGALFVEYLRSKKMWEKTK